MGTEGLAFRSSHARWCACIFVAMFFLVSGTGVFAQDNDKGRYGEDKRKDWFEVTGADLAALANASPAMFSHGQLIAVRKPLQNPRFFETVYKFARPPQTLGAAHRLCDGEKFRHQYAAANCSGVLVDKDLVATAGHCVGNSAGRPTWQGAKFVFGYRAENPTDPGTAEFQSINVYEVKEVMWGARTGWFAVEDGKWLSRPPVKPFLPMGDWAIVKLDRPVPWTTAKPVESQTRVTNEDSVFMIGYPSGLPLKYTMDGKVTEKHDALILTSLDAFHGNSGSGVFNTKTMKLIGLLVNGNEDYTPSADGRCQTVNRCTLGEGDYVPVPRRCRFAGEGVQSVSQWNLLFR